METFFLGKLYDLVKELIKFRSEKAQKKNELIAAIRKAMNRTRFYISQQDLDAAQDDPNIDLSELWGEVATKVRDFNEEAYYAFIGKSEYWASPKKWIEKQKSENSIEELGFKLDQIEELVRELEKS